MTAEEYRYLSPFTRVAIDQDTWAENPLTDWDHGVAFHALPNADRDYVDIGKMSNGPELEFMDHDNYREWWSGEWREPYQNEHNAPSFLTFMNHNAVYFPVYRSGYTGTLAIDSSDDVSEWGGVAYVPLDAIRAEYNVKRVTANIRANVEARIRCVLDEYNAWATGDVYVLTLEQHNPKCPYCEDASQPDTDCPCWDAKDSIGDIIGSDYIDEAITYYFPV